jgi:prolyl oligopeptidase
MQLSWTQKERRTSFLKKKEQKTFTNASSRRFKWTIWVVPVTDKSFLVLFFKKERLARFLWLTPPSPHCKVRRMRIIHVLPIGILLSLQAGATTPEHPPTAAVKLVTDDYFGTKITDPYRWMESEPEPQFRAYLHAENDYARAALARIPGRDHLAKDIGAVSGLAARVRSVVLAGGKSFYLKRDAGAQIERLYVRDAGGHETLLVDPNKFGNATTHAEIDQFQPSQDGALVVYGVSTGGSENSVLRIIETATGKILPDRIDRAQFASASWAPDANSFFFTRLQVTAKDAPATEQFAHMKVYRHFLRTDPAHDTVVLDSDHLPFAFKAAAIFPLISITQGSNYALSVIADGVSPEQAIYAAPLADLLAGHAAWKQVALQSDDVTGVAVHGNRIDLLTHKDTPRFKTIETALDAPNIATAQTVIPEPSGVLTSISAAADGLYFTTRDGAVAHLHKLAYGTAAPVTITLPFGGTISDSGGLVTDPALPGAVFSLESWVRAEVWLRYDPATGHVSDSHIVPPFPHDLSGYSAVETFARAPDGTAIPLSIVTKSGLKLDGKRPTYLVGYGSYGISYDPAFGADFLPWLDRGGVLAVAHVRGGGELGQAWHDAGKIATKQNTIHDFIACAEALIAKGYTDSAHLGGEGTSAGGILIGGAINQRPDLFRAALIRVGATNTLREQFTAGGPANIPEFGDATNPKQFPAMRAMDAYNNVREGVAYPAVLLTGGADDPRVTVWIPAKMTAKLQASTSSGRPVLFRVEFDAGHGIGSTRKQRDDETADEFAFLLWQFGEAGYQPEK